MNIPLLSLCAGIASLVWGLLTVAMAFKFTPKNPTENQLMKLYLMWVVMTILYLITTAYLTVKLTS